MYIIGTLNIVKNNNFISDLGTFDLPNDYFDFLTKYGFGNICDTIYFNEPDRHYVENNFLDYIDVLWNWDSEKQKDMVLDGLYIGNTIDGDIICCVNNNLLPYVFLPRHSEEVISFESFELLHSHCLTYYGLKDVYFDSEFESVRKMITLIKNNSLDKTLIKTIQEIFLKEFKYDKIFNENNQPKYIIQDIGGWVYFDLIYRNSIIVKYQSMYEVKANKIINFIEKML